MKYRDDDFCKTINSAIEKLRKIETANYPLSVVSYADQVINSMQNDARKAIEELLTLVAIPEPEQLDDGAKEDIRAARLKRTHRFSFDDGGT